MCIRDRYGTYGLVNHPDVTETTVADGAKGTTNWKDKTPDEILLDINTAISATWEAAGFDTAAIPNHILVPYEQYLYLVNTKVSELATKSILDYLLENNIVNKDGKGQLYIGATAWCKGAGTGGKDRMVVYVNHERCLLYTSGRQQPKKWQRSQRQKPKPSLPLFRQTYWIRQLPSAN